MVVSKKNLDKKRKKNAIIDAAELLFFTKGFDRSTMDDLAKEAQFSKRTLYVYFNSKEQIYFEIMIRGYRRLIAMLNKGEYPEAKADAKLRQMTQIFYQFSKEFPDYFTAIFSYENGEMDFQNDIPDESRETCYALGEVIFNKLTTLIKEGQETGVFRSELNVVETAIILWSSMIGIFNTSKTKANYIQNYHSVSPDALVSSAFELMIRSIRNNNGGIS